MSRTQAAIPSELRNSAGLRAAIRILEKWGATQEQLSGVLRISRSTYDYAMESKLSGVSMGPDQLTRISLILNIHAALRTVFESPENVYGFMTRENHNAWFNGRTPLEAIIIEGLPGLYETCHRINSLVVAQ